MNNSRFVIALLCTLLTPGITHAQERLFAAAGGALHEVSLDPGQLGAILRSWPLSASAYPDKLVVFDRGRKIGWTSISDSMLHLHVFDITTETFTRFPIAPSSLAALGIVGVADVRESLIFVVEHSNAAGSGRTLLEWHIPTRRILQSVDLRGPVVRRLDYAYAPDAHVVFALRSPQCLFCVPGPQWIDVVDLNTGGVRERAFDVPYGFGQRIATNPSGTRLWVSTAETGFNAPASVGVFDTPTGRLLDVNVDVDPEVDSQDRTFLQYVDPGVVLLVTKDGLTSVDAETLQPIASANAPQFRLPSSQIPPGYHPRFGYDVLIYPASRAIVAYEWASVSYSYHGSTCLQSALVLLNPRNGERITTRNLAEVAGGPVCGARFALTVLTP